MLVLLIAFQIVSIAGVVWLILRNLRLEKEKESEFYTDYRHGNLIMRIYKPEFEYQAIGNVPRHKILDRGTLSQFYIWALLEQ